MDQSMEFTDISASDFIQECITGKKSASRRSKEHIIESFIKKKSPDRGGSPNQYNRESRDERRYSPYNRRDRDYHRTPSRQRDVPRSNNRRSHIGGKVNEKRENRSDGDTSSQDVLERISKALKNFYNKNKKNKMRMEINNVPKMLLDKLQLSNFTNEQEFTEGLEKYSLVELDEILKNEQKRHVQAAKCDAYYTHAETGVTGTEKDVDLCGEFEKLVKRGEDIRASKPVYEPVQRRPKIVIPQLKSDEDTSEGNETEERIIEQTSIIMELERKQKHPDRLHPELWHNDPGELNDGPLCRCREKCRTSGIRHNVYAGETLVPLCKPFSNNANRLFHYRITISPPTNFLIKTPTVIKHDGYEYIFEGFSLFSHYEIPKLPPCKVIRFNINYTILYIKENVPDNFTVEELNLFSKFLFYEILELVDFNLYPSSGADGCPMYHFMPRFVRDLPENGTEILPMCKVLEYLLESSTLLVDEQELSDIHKMGANQWQDKIQHLKGMVVTKPGVKPCSLRVDQLDKDVSAHPENPYPDIVHFGMRPPQLSYAGNKRYQRLWRSYVKYRHMIANLPKPTSVEKGRLQKKEEMLNSIKTKSKQNKGVTVVLSCEGFLKTGIMCDIVQHAMLLPVLVCHLRFHRSLDSLESRIKYKFKNRQLLQMALTHPSYRENYGTNPDHVRNILTNCGIRQPEYGDRRIHYVGTRKRGINTLINIMSKFGKTSEMQSTITHNERLEFLGDAVIEFITSVHLYFLFPDLEEGGLATYRAAIVQNQNLTLLAKVLKLDEYMLFAHGSDLCHDLELRHAMANCFEALLASIYLDGGIEVADRVFSETFMDDKRHLLPLWMNHPKHPLQEQEPKGDRKWIPSFPMLQKLTHLEQDIGIEFTHIRLLARAFTDRSVGYTNLTLGSNQRMEFLGDTVLQLICSTYLYKHFPDHHEGHLSLLRSSLVNNRTQSIVCDDLRMASYALYANPKDIYKVKDRADLLEAFLGALYIDKGVVYCEEFCKVCFFPRLQEFIINQNWNDPKSKLQQCCLTLRSAEGQEPDIPLYKVIGCKGPTNGRIYTVAVYFRGQRLASGRGHNIQQAEMNAAKKALSISQDLFPRLSRGKRETSKAKSETFMSDSDTSVDRRSSDENSDDDFHLTSTLGDLVYQHRKKKKKVSEDKTKKKTVPKNDIVSLVSKNKEGAKVEQRDPSMDEILALFEKKEKIHIPTNKTRYACLTMLDIDGSFSIAKCESPSESISDSNQNRGNVEQITKECSLYEDISDGDLPDDDDEC